MLANHPQLEPLRQCLEALRTPHSPIVQIGVEPASGFYPTPQGIEIYTSHTHARKYKEVVSRKNLPKNATGLVVDYRPFEVGKEDPHQLPTYELHLAGPFFEDETDVLKAFGNLMRARRLQPERKSRDHWNLANKGRSGVFSISRPKKGHVVLTASNPESLLALANHYFHHAQPVAAPGSARKSTTAKGSIGQKAWQPQVQITARMKNRRRRGEIPGQQRIRFLNKEKTA